MNKVLVLLFFSFLSLYADFVDMAYTNYDSRGNPIIVGKVGDWIYKQEDTPMKLITSFTLFDDENNAKVFIEFGESEYSTYISIESEVIDKDVGYLFFIADSVNKNDDIKEEDDFILEYLNRQNIYNGIVQISGLDAYNLINKFIKYNFIVLYNDYEVSDEIARFESIGLYEVFKRLVPIFKN